MPFLQSSLSPGNNLVTNCTVSDWSQWKRTYQPGLAWGGVGNNYTYLDISNGPHAGILGGGEHRKNCQQYFSIKYSPPYPAGNNCIFEYNYLHDLCYEVTDSGAFYTGRSWILRGNIIRYCHFANVQTTEKTYLGSPSVQAIYLDDQVYVLSSMSYIFIICIVMIDEWIHYSRQSI